MICRLCHKACHEKCKIPYFADKTSRFKDCECFMWQVPKRIRITNEATRKLILEKVNDCTFSVASDETYEKLHEEKRLRSGVNFTVNSVQVRGNPSKEWTTNGFSTDASCYDTTVTTSSIRSAPLGYEFVMHDWSNVEKGEGMLCKRCNCPLSQHMHQTTLPVWKENPIFTEAGMEMKTKEEALKACESELEKMVTVEKEIKEKLKKSLEDFGEVAIASSYVGFLNEQLSYLKLLARNAETADDQTALQNLNSQIRMIEDMKKTFESTESLTSEPPGRPDFMLGKD